MVVLDRKKNTLFAMNGDEQRPTDFESLERQMQQLRGSLQSPQTLAYSNNAEVVETAFDPNADTWKSDVAKDVVTYGSLVVAVPVVILALVKQIVAPDSDWTFTIMFLVVALLGVGLAKYKPDWIKKIADMVPFFKTAAKS